MMVTMEDKKIEVSAEETKVEVHLPGTEEEEEEGQKKKINLIFLLI